MKKPITLIKLGGSLITDKTKPFTVKQKSLDLIASEVKKATETGTPLIIGHGAGSFGHIPAKKYQTHKGMIQKDSLEGIVAVADATRQLNAIVMRALLAAGVKAVAISPMSMSIADNFELGGIFTDSLEKLVELGIVPVVYGDQVVDVTRGCAVFSTEKVLAFIGLALQKKKYSIERIIHCGQTNGVYDADGNTIDTISNRSFPEIKSVLSGSAGIDVTGGMLQKVEETLALAQAGIPGLIIDGIEHGSLSKAIAGEEVLGTKIIA